MKSLSAFSQLVLEDLGDRCHISTGRDAKTVAARIEHEGNQFLTITLPKFGKDFQKSLDRGFVAHDVFLSFKRHGGLPQFLGGFLELVFDRKTGRLLDKPSIDAIYAVHQFSSMFGKIKDPCSDARIRDAMLGFLECEKNVQLSDMNRDPELVSRFNRISSLLFRDVFTAVDRLVYNGELTPKHGPGATAEKLRANEKYSNMEWTSRLEEIFPSGEFLFPNVGWYQTSQQVVILEPGEERPVRVVTVPKTAKTPRIIAIEPTCMQYAQQALLEAISEEIHRDDILRSLLGNLDQGPNRLLAKRGSIDGSLATLDLSEASDRVSNQLVRGMLSPWPHLHKAVDASRSRKADVPGIGVLRLAKFASMGSALCFAVEAIVFSTIVFMAYEQELNRPLTRKDVKSRIGLVRIYGDDIIVPVDMVSRVITLLEAFGLKVNVDKSFWTGKFRESCGGDFYDGTDITPVRMRQEFPRSRKHITKISSTVAFRNLLFEKGFEKAVAGIDEYIGKFLPVYPFLPMNHPGMGRWTYDYVPSGRMCDRHHKPLIKVPVVRNRIPSDELGEHGALMKYFLKRSDLPFADRKHLQYAGRAESVDIKTRWVPLFDMRERP